MPKKKQHKSVLIDNLGVVFDCGSSLNINQVQENYDTLLTLLNSSNKRILIDAGQLSTIDTASLQLLLCFIQTAKTADIQVQWKTVSPELLNYVQLVGLQELLGLPKP